MPPQQVVPVVHSFVLPHEVNFWSYTGAADPNRGAFSTASTGNMDVDDPSGSGGGAGSGTDGFRVKKISCPYGRLPRARPGIMTQNAGGHLGALSRRALV